MSSPIDVLALIQTMPPSLFYQEIFHCHNDRVNSFINVINATTHNPSQHLLQARGAQVVIAFPCHPYEQKIYLTSDCISTNDCCLYPPTAGERSSQLRAAFMHRVGSLRESRDIRKFVVTGSQIHNNNIQKLQLLARLPLVQKSACVGWLEKARDLQATASLSFLQSLFYVLHGFVEKELLHPLIVSKPMTFIIPAERAADACVSLFSTCDRLVLSPTIIQIWNKFLHPGLNFMFRRLLTTSLSFDLLLINLQVEHTSNSDTADLFAVKKRGSASPVYYLFGNTLEKKHPTSFFTVSFQLEVHPGKDHGYNHVRELFVQLTKQSSLVSIFPPPPQLLLEPDHVHRILVSNLTTTTMCQAGFPLHSFQQQPPPVSQLSPFLITTLTPLQKKANARILLGMAAPIVQKIGLRFPTDYVLRPHKLTQIKPLSEEFQRAQKVFSNLLSTATGTGKTATALAAMLADFQQSPSSNPYVFLVPDLLVSQWVSEIHKHTTLSKESLVVLSSVKDTQIMTVRKNHNEPMFVIISHCAFRSGTLNLLFPMRALVIDEIHTINRPTVLATQINNTVRHVHYVLGLSATPWDSWLTIRSLLSYEDVKKVFPHCNHEFLCATLLHGKPSERDDSSNTKINVCMVKPSPFLQQAHVLLDGISRTYKSTTASMRRIMRIYERICAGGFIDEALILSVLKNSLACRDDHAATDAHILLSTTQPAPHSSFGSSGDDCCVCMSNFERPVSLSCGHILCFACCSSMVAIGRRTCPQCRQSLHMEPGSKVLVFPPSWTALKKTGDVLLLSQQQEQKNFKKMIEGTACNNNKPCFKRKKFEELLFSYRARRTPESRLVVFTKAEKPANSYHALLLQHELKVVTAGAMKTNRKDSVTNIDLFRAGKADVLLCNYKYAVGFDFAIATDSIITDFDLKTSSIIQAMGRTTRLGQTNLVRVFILVTQNCFDDFLFRNRNKIKGGDIMNMTLRSAFELEAVTQLSNPTSRFGKMRKAIEISLGRPLVFISPQRACESTFPSHHGTVTTTTTTNNNFDALFLLPKYMSPFYFATTATSWPGNEHGQLRFTNGATVKMSYNKYKKRKNIGGSSLDDFLASSRS
jgi:superfamily II DNA or RNA helicase